MGKVGVARQVGWRKVVQEHEAAWSDWWRSSDIEVGGDPAAEQALRFAVYHLNSAANPADERVSIGARGLTGDDYHGHVFWDTEIYLLPFYVFTWPEAARALLMYRFRTIDGARQKAARWDGAAPCTPGNRRIPVRRRRRSRLLIPTARFIDILCGKQEQHITADIAYAVWQYWQATKDVDFLLDAGAEILSRRPVWSSRAQPEEDGYCHIRGVIGPDEYHEHIDDNAYTNVMARWNIRRALEVAALLREGWPDRWARLSYRLGLEDTELVRWRTVARQCSPAGILKRDYSSSSPVSLALRRSILRATQADQCRWTWCLGGANAAPKVIKQADVVALLGLLPEEFPGDSGRANFRYYEPRCGTAVPSAARCMGWSRPGWATRTSHCGISSMRWRSIWQITTQ